MDDSDDEDQQPLQSSGGGGGGHHVSFALGGGAGAALKIPPTHKSRVDSSGVQIVTSYRANPSNKSQLLKTVTKVKVETVKVKEAKSVQARRGWARFGQAKKDEASGTKTTVQSKDEIFLEDPHADTDLQDEDPAAAIAGNLNAFWAKQQRRQLERKYDVHADDGLGAGGDGLGGLAAAAAAAAGGGGWTQVGARASGAAGAAASTGKYIPPAARGGLAAAAAASLGDAGGAGAYRPDRRDDVNTLRVTNLSENTTEADLQELFQRFGRISRVYLAKDKETFQSRGFAFVSFVNKDDAARAMEELQGYGTLLSSTVNPLRPCFRGSLSLTLRCFFGASNFRLRPPDPQDRIRPAQRSQGSRHFGDGVPERLRQGAGTRHQGQRLVRVQLDQGHAIKRGAWCAANLGANPRVY
jgi:translation initiation factor 3 subunit G